MTNKNKEVFVRGYDVPAHRALTSDQARAFGYNERLIVEEGRPTAGNSNEKKVAVKDEIMKFRKFNNDNK